MKIILRIAAVGIALLVGNAVLAADRGNMYLNANVGGNYLQEVNGVDFDIGVRFDAALGYHLNETWALEFETGWLWNAVSDTGRTDVNLYQIPFLVNAVYHFQTDGKWKPYVGGGAGGVCSVFSVSDRSFDESDSDFTGAFQAKAGVAYVINDNMMVDFGYKLFATLSPEWEIDHRRVNPDETFFNHGFLVSFTWYF